MTVPCLDPADGVAFFESLLRQSDRERDVPPDRRRDVVAWLGGNPRALQLVIAALAASSLDELVGMRPEAWELRDRAVSPELVQDLERELLRKVRAHLTEAEREIVGLLSVHRKPFKGDVLDVLVPTETQRGQVRRRLSEMFLLEQRQGWYSLNPVAREVARQALQVDLTLLRRAHSFAGDAHARHFRATQIVGGARLGGHFVEARYHLVQAGRGDELGDIAQRFGEHIRSEMSAASAPPHDARELDERIAVLRALLEEEGPKGLEYHLARCLVARRREGDSRLALEHARRATGRQAPADAWVLRIRLEGELSGPRAALAAAREGIAKVPPDKNVFALYQSAGEMLARAGRSDEAVQLLREGITKIPPDKGLPALYQSAGETLARAGRSDEAVQLLREGMTRVPPDKGVHSIYQTAGVILFRRGDKADAVELLRHGLRAIPYGQFQRLRIGEALVFNLAAMGDVGMLVEVAGFVGADALDLPALGLARTLRQELEGNWSEALVAARAARSHAPGHLPLALHEALS